LTYSEMGVILGSVILMYVPLSVPVGVGIDRFGQKKMITFGILLISFSAILRSVVFNFETLFLVVFLFGFGGPTVSVGLAKVVSSFFEGRERGFPRHSACWYMEERVFFLWNHWSVHCTWLDYTCTGIIYKFRADQ
jgi:MFS family permease